MDEDAGGKDDVAPPGAPGGEASFEEFYALLFKPLVRYCTCHLPLAEDPEELAQEVFLKVWRFWDRYDNERPMWPWLTTIARRLCIDHVRHSSVHNASAEDCKEPVPQAAPHDIVQAREDLRSAVLALNAMRPVYRRLILMRELQSMSYAQIAQQEGVTVESVRATLRRARCVLRDARPDTTARTGAAPEEPWSPTAAHSASRHRERQQAQASFAGSAEVETRRHGAARRPRSLTMGT